MVEEQAGHGSAGPPVPSLGTIHTSHTFGFAMVFSILRFHRPFPSEGGADVDVDVDAPVRQPPFEASLVGRTFQALA
ncbi:hypothetical protein ACGF5C_04860 [Micromonospora sp. NPDC047620]|uniref:hypothetical protein n=1 Tax=Micromonospora sp. NPDC047620 TaxID=3364251 RepID=UPI00371F3A5D